MRPRIYLAIALSMVVGGLWQAAAAAALTGAEDWAIAEAFWGRAPTACETITWRDDPAPTHLGEATTPSGGWRGACRIAVQPGLDSVTTCLVIVHEFGHLLGERHSSSPTSIMWSGLTLNTEAVPACGADAEAARIARRQAWTEWREQRAECQEVAGPWRKRCWRRLRASRAAGLI